MRANDKLARPSGDFRWLLLARVCGMLGIQAQGVLIGWHVYQLTHDPLMLGLIGLTEAVPAVLAALYAGHIVDRSRPYIIYLRVTAFLACVAGALYYIAAVPHGWAVREQLTLIFALIFCSGIARSFVMPTTFTLLNRLVPRAELAGATAWMTSGFHLAAILGPAIAGVAYAALGPGVAWAMPLACLALALGMALRISAPHRRYRNPSDPRERARDSMRAGWNFLRSNPVLLSVMALDMVAVLFGGAIAILPAFADQVLALDAAGLGVLRAAPAAGSILSALYFALRPMREIHGRTLLLSVAGFGLAMLGFALSQTLALATLFLALSGASDSISMVIRGTLMQWMVPDAMRGRVTSVNSMFVISSNEIGAFESGVAARIFGLVPSLLIGGGLTLVTVAAMARGVPSLRRLRVAAAEA